MSLLRSESSISHAIKGEMMPKMNVMNIGLIIIPIKATACDPCVPAPVHELVTEVLSRNIILFLMQKQQCLSISWGGQRSLDWDGGTVLPWWRDDWLSTELSTLYRRIERSSSLSSLLSHSWLTHPPHSSLKAGISSGETSKNNGNGGRGWWVTVTI